MLNAFFAENQFGVHELEILARKMWFLLTLQFGEQQARHESIQIKFSDIAWKKTNAGVLNIQDLALSEASNTNRALGISAQKRRRVVIESSDEEDYNKKILRASVIQLISLSLQFLWAVTNSDDICQNESICFKILSRYLNFSVYKQLVVAIHFTGLPSELREIIGLLKMHTKRSSAAARGLALPKKWKKIVVIW